MFRLPVQSRNVYTTVLQNSIETQLRHYRLLLLVLAPSDNLCTNMGFRQTERLTQRRKKTKYLLLTYSTDTLVTFSRTSHAYASFHRNLRQKHQSKSVSATWGLKSTWLNALALSSAEVGLTKFNVHKKVLLDERK